MRSCSFAIPLLAVLYISLFPTRGNAQTGEHAWIEPMKRVRARFTGTPGTFAAFGDSITVTMAFWAPLRGELGRVAAKV